MAVPRITDTPTPLPLPHLLQKERSSSLSSPSRTFLGGACSSSWGCGQQQQSKQQPQRAMAVGSRTSDQAHEWGKGMQTASITQSQAQDQAEECMWDTLRAYLKEAFLLCCAGESG